MLAPLTALARRVMARLAAEEGQGLTEYALLLALIAVAAILALAFMGGRVTSELSTIATTVSSV